jgi:hypothetical protein
VGKGKRGVGKGEQKEGWVVRYLRPETVKGLRNEGNRNGSWGVGKDINDQR